jgi:hypothetical protein
MRTTLLFLAFSLLLLLQTQRSFAQPSMGVSSFATGGTITLSANAACTEGKSGSMAGFTFYVRSGANCAINNATGTGSDGHINLITSPLVTGIWQEGRVASSDGSRFKLQNFVFAVLTDPFVGKTLTVTGYRSGSPVPGALVVSPLISTKGIANTFMVDCSVNPHFSNIDEFRITPSGTDAQGTLSIHSIEVSTAIALPLHFLDIRTSFSGESLSVFFSTAEESGVADYEVQVSGEDNQFVTRDRIKAKNEARQDYRTEIKLPAKGAYQVRIKANEQDGTVKYSRIVLVQKGAVDRPTVYPNPAIDRLYVSGVEGAAYLVTNAPGVVLQKGQVVNGQVNIATLPRGLFVLQVAGHSFRILKK